MKTILDHNDPCNYLFRIQQYPVNTTYNIILFSIVILSVCQVFILFFYLSPFLWNCFLCRDRRHRDGPLLARRSPAQLIEGGHCWGLLLRVDNMASTQQLLRKSISTNGPKQDSIHRLQVIRVISEHLYRLSHHGWIDVSQSYISTLISKSAQLTAIISIYSKPLIKVLHSYFRFSIFFFKVNCISFAVTFCNSFHSLLVKEADCYWLLNSFLS